MVRRRSVLLLVILVSILAALAGWFAGRTIQSPADALNDVEAPPPSRITVPVESRVLASNVVVRGQVELSDAVEIVVDQSLSQAGAPLVITDTPVADGAEVAEGTPIIEVSERPIALLEGEVPMFRAITLNDEGDDVKQLEEALLRMGLPPGTVDGRFDGATEGAVREWYKRMGYPVIEPDTAAKEALKLADQSVETSRATLDAARRDLAAAQLGPSTLERQQAQINIDNAKSALRDAQAAGESNLDQYRLNIQVEEDALRQLNQVDATAQTKAVVDAQRNLTSAESDLAELRSTTGITVSRGEVQFVQGLPRRLDEVLVERGAVVAAGSSALRLSSAEILVESALSEQDLKLVRADDKVRLEEQSLGIDMDGTVTFIAGRKGGDGTPDNKYLMRVTPDTYDEALLGQNVRITIPIQATDGEVLAVPVAAVFATADGSAKIEIEDDPGLPTRFVVVEPGLSADGYLEVTPLDGALEPGARVVVGVDGRSALSDEPSEAGSTSDGG